MTSLPWSRNPWLRYRARRSPLVGSSVVLVVCYGTLSVSYPQLPPRKEHGCTVGIDWDPPVCDALSRQDDGVMWAPPRAGVVKCFRGRE